MEQFVVDQQHTIFSNDALQSAQSLTSESNTPADISAKFGTITYSKGRLTDLFNQHEIIFYCFFYHFITNPFTLTVCTTCSNIKNLFTLKQCIYRLFMIPENKQPLLS